jgi:single-strand DNA-binding protein
MASFNRVILLGNLTRDIQLKHLPSGLALSEFGLAVNDRHKNANGEWVDETCFVDITLFGRTAEVASEYLHKGSPVLIEGRLKYDSWEKEGKKFSKLRVIGDRMQMLGTKGGGMAGGGNGAAGNAAPPMNATNSAIAPVRSSGPAVAATAARPPAMPSSGGDFGGFSAGGDTGGPVNNEDIPF